MRQFYEPFGKEWKTEMMKLKKADIIEFYKEALMTATRNKFIKNKEVCVWAYDEWSDYYDTGCGEAYCLVDGTLEENAHLYCPYCGGEIKLKSET